MNPEKLTAYLGLAAILIFLILWGISKYRQGNSQNGLAAILAAIAVAGILAGGPLQAYFNPIHNKKTAPYTFAAVRQRVHWKHYLYQSHADSVVYSESAESAESSTRSVTRH